MISGKASADVIRMSSSAYLQFAKSFEQECKTIEQGLPESGSLPDDLRRFVVAGTFFLAASVEARLNELLDPFLESTSNEAELVRSVSSKPLELPWEPKLRLAGQLAGLTIDLGRQPWQGLRILFDVRNAFVHPKPIVNSNVTLSKSLRAHLAKEKRSRWGKSDDDVFPLGVYSSGWLELGLEWVEQFQTQFKETTPMGAQDRRNREFNQMRRAAWHELGHAVMARQLGIEVVSVSLFAGFDSGLITTNPLQSQLPAEQVRLISVAGFVAEGLDEKLDDEQIADRLMDQPDEKQFMNAIGQPFPEDPAQKAAARAEARPRLTETIQEVRASLDWMAVRRSAVELLRAATARWAQSDFGVVNEDGRLEMDAGELEVTLEPAQLGRFFQEIRPLPKT